MDKKIIEFIRKKDYEFLKELGQGACGKTVLLNDDIINQKLVCKKYCPFNERHRVDLFKRFIDEIKILYLLYHRNIVRVYNCYIYPNAYAGYILMEYIEGYDIEDYLKKYPENLNDIFSQAISGFKYLEGNNILHR
ncbi:MAG: protein kinase, partial [Actinobacteria bacterium]|nr:protein kinase [Actinomycetota bacterium]